MIMYEDRKNRNDNQIRCTLTRADLLPDNLKLSELAYGTEKQMLFHDMMRFKLPVNLV